LFKKIAVLAPGGIGAAVGGLLTRAGHDVVLIDQWAEHVEAMKAHGLKMTIGTRQEPEGEFTVKVRAHHLYEVCAMQPRPQFDLVFLTAKSYDTQWLVEFIKPFLAPDATLVSMQNSMNDEWIIPMIGAERDLACVLTGGGELLEPGHVWRNRSINHPYYTLGEVDGRMTPRLEEVVKVLSDAGKVKTSTEIMGAKWTKLIRNAQGAVSSLCNMRSWLGLNHQMYLPAVAKVGREAMLVGKAAGYKTEPINGLTAADLEGDPQSVSRAILEDARVGGSEKSISMVQHDIKVGRPTEVAGYLNGLVVQKGREFGIPTPANEIIIDLHGKVERGELPWDISNLELVSDALKDIP
jgi:2-dehydropantoate 2-reductase